MAKAPEPEEETIYFELNSDAKQGKMGEKTKGNNNIYTQVQYKDQSALILACDQARQLNNTLGNIDMVDGLFEKANDVYAAH